MSPIICPTITADDEQQYHLQMKKVADFAHRIQIDLMDGVFAPGPNVKPTEAWWPIGLKADIHLMYEEPLAAVKQLAKHRPHLVIVHAEAEGKFSDVAEVCLAHKIKIGIALLPKTAVSEIAKVLDNLDHVLIFSGSLGHQGGSRADFDLLQKVAAIKKLKSSIEVGWDGGINDQNVPTLVTAGVDVLNVGGYIQHSNAPHKAFEILQRIADETGTT